MKALYVTDRTAIGDEAFGKLLEQLRDAPGLTVQVREKEASDRDALAAAARAKTKLGAVPLLINRRLDIALAAGAAGVHLPSDGLPLRRVRSGTPRGFLVGISAHSAGEAAAAVADGADLVVIGPIFDTPSKRRYGSPLGPEELSRLPLSSEHESDVYAIGGIDEERMKLLRTYNDRIAGIAAIRLFQESPNPRETVARVVSL
ncbi:MAG TPA: thiamine phosphate synthase [Thermoanaerobaculia bacterium]